jgi:hypothetical protein
MVVYFEKPGNYTDEVLEIVKKRVEKGDIKQIIIATTSGATALEAMNYFSNVDLIAVTHQAGFRAPGEMEIPDETVNTLKENNVTVVTATHALAGIDRAIRKKHGTWMIAELIAETFRVFGQGTKVCAEIVAMAADAGVITMEDLIAVGGTGRGADTAWVIKPAHTQNFFDMKIKELLCKPA